MLRQFVVYIKATMYSTRIDFSMNRTSKKFSIFEFYVFDALQKLLQLNIEWKQIQ